MSFINKTEGKGWDAGYFLAGGDETCTRLTKTIKADHAQVVTTEYGTKYVPAGAIWPSNDENAEGILYENVDVTTGDMPGSVVLKGVVYEDRLPITDASYDAVTLKDLVSPKAQGWQERS